MAADLEKLNRKLDSPFAGLGLLRLALTHRSYGAANNERLEFLGDSILNFVVAKDLYERFPTAREGRLSRMRAQMVKRSTLAEVARELQLGDYLIMGSGELKSGGFDRDSILSDALEAIIGAVYIECGIQHAAALISGWFDSRLSMLSPEDTQKDAKTLLQEYLQALNAPLPEYRVTDVSGESHDQKFYVEVASEHLPMVFLGQGSSRRKAEQSAAKKALRELGLVKKDRVKKVSVKQDKQ